MNDTTNNTATNNTAIATVNDDGVHTFQAYDSKNAPSAATNGRIVAACYRAVEGQEAKRPNSYIEIMDVTEDAIKARLEDFLPHFVSYVADVQDKLIKAVHSAGNDTISIDAYSLVAVLDHLDSTNTVKLDRSTIYSWFDDSVKDNLTAAIAVKVNPDIDSLTDEQLSTINDQVSAYRQQFGALGGNTSFMDDTKNALLRAIEVTEANQDRTGRTVKAKLEAMNKKVVATLAAL